MNESSVQMSLSASVSLAYTLGTQINNGNWHYVALSVEDNEVTLYSDGFIGDSYTFAPDKPV